ncbi:MAG: hypothetical protein N2691_05085 [Patescibacteria group bacterium]|nr:hypothetical protein [Patescibacteria group bacterium]
MVEESGWTLGSSLAILAGLVVSFLIEKVIHWRHCHLPFDRASFLFIARQGTVLQLCYGTYRFSWDNCRLRSDSACGVAESISDSFYRRQLHLYRWS